MSRSQTQDQLHFRYEFIGKSGKRYWIQTVPEEYKEVAASYLVYGFSKEEPTMKFCSASTFVEFLNGAKRFWREGMDKGPSLICLTKNENEEVQFVGVNYLNVATNDKKKEPILQKDSTTKIMEIIRYVEEKGDPFTKLTVTECLQSAGLYVLPEFRGDGVGMEFLKARKPLCEGLGLNTTCTVFTSRVSQKIAEKVGFKDLFSIDYEELAKIKPELTFPGIENDSKSIRYMYKQYFQ